MCAGAELCSSAGRCQVGRTKRWVALRLDGSASSVWRAIAMKRCDEVDEFGECCDGENAEPQIPGPDEPLGRKADSVLK